MNVSVHMRLKPLGTLVEMLMDMMEFTVDMLHWRVQQERSASTELQIKWQTPNYSVGVDYVTHANGKVSVESH